MRRTTHIALAAALPLAGFAGEKPVWEIQARLAGLEKLPLEVWKGAGVAREEALPLIGDKAVVRIASFRNEATPGQDWVAEIRDLARPAELLEKLRGEGKPDDLGRLMLEEQGTTFLVWLDGGSTLRLASPAENAAAVVEPSVTLGEAEWITGRVDLSCLEGVESAVMQLPESIAFSAAAEGEGAKFRLDAAMADPSMVELGRLMVEELAAGLTPEDGPPLLKIETSGKNLGVTLTLTAEQIQEVAEQIQGALPKPDSDR